MILLDTNICIYIINAKPVAVLERFKHHRLGEIGLCSVVAAELAFGVAKSGSARNRQALEMFLAPLTILPFDERAAWAYGDLRAELEGRGTPIGSLDTMIAAHALSQQATLITNNTREFAQVPGLHVENWVPTP
ncbi:type II toxin-antitoxin system VapC family toxin [Synechococcus sp. EJ6-Ellesmere]|uniref:type II toxin-antitoxin system tRNA(fMet)-specific endonuclease VapC n=1 Tax=Synechococcus sp. EJ6-Ellesmere TaxID=2823734 RepID=UPI0020CCADA2|nr:type II toxin-antitoxin system VapC family toxin [Synechococcus sp. EJ6-Ellesmere]MCP9825317.1 type II toxin-antitoxin system VapC family toxin [Synechococcus sp. EJ6-Ellesmere]